MSEKVDELLNGIKHKNLYVLLSLLLLGGYNVTDLFTPELNKECQQQATDLAITNKKIDDNRKAVAELLNEFNYLNRTFVNEGERYTAKDAASDRQLWNERLKNLQLQLDNTNRQLTDLRSLIQERIRSNSEGRNKQSFLAECLGKAPGDWVIEWPESCPEPIKPQPKELNNGSHQAHLGRTRSDLSWHLG